MKFAFRFFVFGLAVLILTGCAQIFPTMQSPELPTDVPAQVEQIAELSATEVITEEVENTEATSKPTAAKISEEPTSIPATEAVVETEIPPAEVPTEAPTETTPLGSSELHATKPSTVNLASGKVQLVEFFAFW